MPRFAVLEHDHPFLHWDLLLEADGVARCWRLLRRPCADEPIAAEALADHRLLYLDYEGPISGNRGTVVRFASGMFEVFATELDRELSIRLSDWPGFETAMLHQSPDGRWFWTFGAGAVWSRFDREGEAPAEPL